MENYYFFLALYVFGLLISKNMRQGSIWFLFSIPVFGLLFIIGFIYNIPYSIWLSFTKKWYSFFVFWFKTIQGYYQTIGYILIHLGIANDMAGNVNGEILEDMVTAEENTHFGKNNITVSASLGEIEVKQWNQTKFGKQLSKLLNLFFNEKYHTIYAWQYYLLRKKFKADKQKYK